MQTTLCLFQIPTTRNFGESPNTYIARFDVETTQILCRVIFRRPQDEPHLYLYYRRTPSFVDILPATFTLSLFAPAPQVPRVSTDHAINSEDLEVRPQSTAELVTWTSRREDSWSRAPQIRAWMMSQTELNVGRIREQVRLRPDEVAARLALLPLVR